MWNSAILSIFNPKLSWYFCFCEFFSLIIFHNGWFFHGNSNILWYFSHNNFTEFLKFHRNFNTKWDYIHTDIFDKHHNYIFSTNILIFFSIYSYFPFSIFTHPKGKFFFFTLHSFFTFLCLKKSAITIDFENIFHTILFQIFRTLIWYDSLPVKLIKYSNKIKLKLNPQLSKYGQPFQHHDRKIGKIMKRKIEKNYYPSYDFREISVFLSKMWAFMVFCTCAQSPPSSMREFSFNGKCTLCWRVPFNSKLFCRSFTCIGINWKKKRTHSNYSVKISFGNFSEFRTLENHKCPQNKLNICVLRNFSLKSRLCFSVDIAKYSYDI